MLQTATLLSIQTCVLNVKKFSLRHLSRLVLEHLRERAKNHNIFLELDLQVDWDSDRFWTDPERVEQILLHLLDNGIKFTQSEGKVILRVWCEQNQAIFQTVIKEGGKKATILHF